MSDFYSQTNFAFLVDRIVLIFFIVDNVCSWGVEILIKNYHVWVHLDYYMFISMGGLELISCCAQYPGLSSLSSWVVTCAINSWTVVFGVWRVWWSPDTHSLDFDGWWNESSTLSVLPLQDLSSHSVPQAGCRMSLPR